MPHETGNGECWFVRAPKRVSSGKLRCSLNSGAALPAPEGRPTPLPVSGVVWCQVCGLLPSPLALALLGPYLLPPAQPEIPQLTTFSSPGKSPVPRPQLRIYFHSDNTAEMENHLEKKISMKSHNNAFQLFRVFY